MAKGIFFVKDEQIAVFLYTTKAKISKNENISILYCNVWEKTRSPFST